MNEQILAIIYFDEVLGPNTLYSGEDVELNTFDHPDLGRIIEFQEFQKGTRSFIFSFRKYQLISHLFYMQSNKARGGKILMMIAYMIKASYFRREIVDIYKYLESKKPILKDFEEEIRSLEELPNILQKPHKKSSMKNLLQLGSEKFRNQFLEIYNKYFRLLSPEYDLANILQNKTILKKIFLFGTPDAGKTSFIKNSEVIQFHNQEKKDLAVKFFDVIIDNFELLTDECFKTNFNCVKCDSLGNCRKNVQALIQIINLADSDSFEESKSLFEKVIEEWNLERRKEIPLIIIGNLFEDIEREISKKELFEFFQIEEYRSKGINLEYFEMNIMIDDNKIQDVLRFLAKSII